MSSASTTSIRPVFPPIRSPARSITKRRSDWDSTCRSDALVGPGLRSARCQARPGDEYRRAKEQRDHLPGGHHRRSQFGPVPVLQPTKSLAPLAGTDHNNNFLKPKSGRQFEAGVTWQPDVNTQAAFSQPTRPTYSTSGISLRAPARGDCFIGADVTPWFPPARIRVRPLCCS